MMKMLKKNKGFTLIEIIVVIVILAVLMAVAVPSVMSYINEGNNAKYETVARGAMVNAQVQLAKKEAGDYSTDASAMAVAKDKTNEDSGDVKVTEITVNYKMGTDGKTPTTQVESYTVKMEDGNKKTKTAKVTVNKKVTLE